MKGIVNVLALLALFSTSSAIAGPDFQGFETDTGDWYFYDGGVSSDRYASNFGPIGVPSADGAYHAEIFNVPDVYQPGYGGAGWSFFNQGGYDPVYQGTFYQAIDVYIDPTWSGLGFWIDMSPADTDGTGLYAAEGNFRLTADGSFVTVQAINGPILTVIDTAGWYSFEIVWSKGAYPTSLINMDLNVYDSAGVLLGTWATTAIYPQGSHPGQSQYLGNNGYVWIAVWENGFANNRIAIDNVRTGSVPPEELVDHFACYEAKSEPEFPGAEVSLEDQFGLTDGVKVTKTKSLCAPVSKNGEPVLEPSVHLVCYDLEEAAVLGKLTVKTTNQFGEQNLKADKMKTVCVPSFKELPR